MRIATWNINSIRARHERVRTFLRRHDVDVLLLQETKCTPEQFPDFTDDGYAAAVAGINQWNGVAILSRVGLEDVRIGFPGQPAFAKAGSGKEPVVEPRAIGARVGTGAQALDVWSLYIPNGRSLEDPHYLYKLQFLRALREEAGTWTQPALLGGDWNVAPRDVDVWDTFDADIYTTPAEREAFEAFADAGFAEVTREAVYTGLDSPARYTFWDYQKLRFPRDEGMRIDFMWASEPLAERVTHPRVDREERKGTGASDHAPVLVDIG